MGAINGILMGVYAVVIEKSVSLDHQLPSLSKPLDANR